MQIIQAELKCRALCFAAGLLCKLSLVVTRGQGVADNDWLLHPADMGWGLPAQHSLTGSNTWQRA